MGGARETTPLMGGGPGPPGLPPLVSTLQRRLSALSPTALRRNSMRGTEHLVPAMGKLGSFLFLSNLITGARQPGPVAVPARAARGVVPPSGRP